MFEIKLFIAQPINQPLYSIRNTETGIQTLINAATLEPLADAYAKKITQTIRIKGDVITDYDVAPLIVGNTNNEYFIVYAPRKQNSIYDSARNNIEKMNYGELVSVVEIAIPDLNLYKSGILLPIKLLPANMESLFNFINKQENFNNQQENVGNYSPAPVSYYNEIDLFQERQERQVNTTPLSNTPIVQYRADPGTGSSIELTEIKTELEKKINSIQSEQSNKNNQIGEIKKDIAQLFDVLEALIKRIYGGYMYPVIRKTPLRIEGRELEKMSVEDYNKLSAEGKFDRVLFDAILQPYAGSQRNDNRILTVYDKNGGAFYVECNYDPKTQKVGPCKYA